MVRNLLAQDDQQYKGSHLRGLSEDEVVERRKQGLAHTLALKSSRSYAQILRANLFVPVNIIMFILGLALVILGQVSDALISVGVAFFNMLVGTIQEIRAKRVLDRISLLTRPKAAVMRSGHEQAVDPSELVVGDILLLRPGDQIVVNDARIEVDESLLTGESELVQKQQGDCLYSGSFCTSGSAYYRAEKVGVECVANQIASGARAFRRVYTPLQRQINVILQSMLLVAIFFEILLALAIQDNRVPLVDSVKMAVVIIGIVPKGLLLATSVAYALGAVRMVGKGVLVQQANALEAMSNVDVLCLDKTGTLTANALVLEDLRPLQGEKPRLQDLLGSYVNSSSVTNPTSEAIGAVCSGERLSVREEVTFSSARKWSALAFVDATHQGTYILGAPDILLPYLDMQDKQDLNANMQVSIDQGKRILLFAYTPSIVSLYSERGEPLLPSGLVPLGLVVLRDQLRPEAQETLRGFSQAGIQI